MKVAIVGIGIPGSGKTTVLKKMADSRGAAYICPDDIRLEFTGDPNDQTRNEEVWIETYRQIHAQLDAGKDVVIDATNAKQPDRVKLVAHCQLKADQVHGMWFATPYDLCLTRNKKRKRRVPDFAIGLMAGLLEACPPTEAEGFDEISRL